MGKKLQQTFEQLKLAISNALVLRLPDFIIPFIVEIDACYDDPTSPTGVP